MDTWYGRRQRLSASDFPPMFVGRRLGGGLAGKIRQSAAKPNPPWRSKRFFHVQLHFRSSGSGRRFRARGKRVDEIELSHPVPLLLLFSVLNYTPGVRMKCGAQSAADKWEIR